MLSFCWLFLLGFIVLVQGRSSSNSIGTIAGTGSSTSSGTGGPPLSAGLGGSRSVFVDTADVVYILEQSGRCIRKFSSSVNIMQVHAGTCGSSGSTGDGGAATAAKFTNFVTFFIDTVGTTYIADYGNHKIRNVATSGIVTVYGGTGTGSDTGDGGMATSAGIRNPHGVWVNTAGVLYVCYIAMRTISTAGIITVAAGK